MGRPSRIKIVRLAAIWNFFRGGHEKLQKTAFFAKNPSPRYFLMGKFFRDRTMRKLTSWGFRKCGTFWAYELFNGSYCCSKSKDFEIFGPKNQNCGTSFFLTPHNFGDTSTFADMIWLWAAITPVKKLARPKSTTFSETSGRELSHGPIPEKFSHTKMLRRRDFSKKRRFLQFFVSAPKKISNGCQSDNFDPRRSAHGSS